jgi:hypothetical protein
MGMKAMLISLLVIAAVAMLETDASAYHCPRGVACPWLCAPKDLEKMVADYKKYEAKEEKEEVLIVWFFDRPMNSKKHDSMSHKMDAMRERLIQRGVPPDSIRELMLEGRAPKACKRGDEIVVYLR